MKIILNNGAELAPIIVTGAHKMVQGANRDCLTFVFHADAGMEALDSLFTPANCESITIVEDAGASYIHKCYTIRTELVQKNLEVRPETPETAAVYEDRITVTMAQRTYMESKMKDVEAALAALAGKEV